MKIELDLSLRSIMSSRLTFFILGAGAGVLGYYIWAVVSLDGQLDTYCEQFPDDNLCLQR